MRNITVDQEKAIKKLSRLKVNKLIDVDYNEKEYKSYFDCVWWSVLRELDLYRDGEDYGLNSSSARTTNKWLKDNQEFTIQFKDVRL